MAEPILIGVAMACSRASLAYPKAYSTSSLSTRSCHHHCGRCGTAAEQPTVFQIASGTRQPLLYRRLVDLVTDYYRRKPLYDSNGQPILMGDWGYPTRGKVQKQLDQAITTLATSERILQMLPLRGSAGAWAGQLEEQRSQAETRTRLRRDLRRLHQQ